ncbi:MAG: tetratricopeptide repeat protein [Cyanobacteria bacterium J06643_4]
MSQKSRKVLLLAGLGLLIFGGKPATAQIRGVVALMREAETALTAGEFEQAESLLQQAIEREPTLTSAYVQLGQLLIEINDNQGAEAAFREAIRLDSQLADAYAGLSNVLLQQYRPYAAELAVMQALRLDESNAIAHQTLGHIRYDQYRWEEAIDAYRIAINGAEYDSFLMKRTANAFVELEQWDAALGTMMEAVDLYPASVGRVADLADLWVSMGNPEEAEAAYLAAIERNPDNPWLYDDLSDFLYEQGRDEEGDSARESALAAAENDASYLLAIAMTSYSDEGRLSEAENLVQRAIALEPGNAQFPIGIALLRRQQGDLVGAAAAYQASLDIEPNSRYLIDMADILVSLSELEEAEVAYRAALNESDGAGYAYVALGRFLASRGRPAEALIALSEARELGNQTAELQAEIEALMTLL